MACTKKTIQIRQWKKVDVIAFKHDIKSSLVIPENNPVDKSIDIYNTVLRKIVEKHAPLQEKKITVRPQTQWYMEEIKKEETIRLCQVTNKLLYKNKCIKLPSTTSDVKLAYWFAYFFSNKIADIRNGFQEEHKEK